MLQCFTEFLVIVCTGFPIPFQSQDWLLPVSMIFGSWLCTLKWSLFLFITAEVGARKKFSWSWCARSFHNFCVYYNTCILIENLADDKPGKNSGIWWTEGLAFFPILSSTVKLTEKSWKSMIVWNVFPSENKLSYSCFQTNFTWKN